MVFVNLTENETKQHKTGINMYKYPVIIPMKA